MLLFKEVAALKIEKNIMATLKREMDKRGVNYVELSEAIDVPRTTLQGYLNGLRIQELTLWKISQINWGSLWQN